MRRKTFTSAALLVLSASLVLSGCIATPETTIDSSYSSTAGATQEPTFGTEIETKPSLPCETEGEGPSDSMTNVVAPTETVPATTTETAPETEPEETVPEETEPDIEAGMSFAEVNETVYANTTVNIRKGPSTDYEKIATLKWGESVIRIGRGDRGWDKVLYEGEPAYMYSEYIQTEEPVAAPAETYPLSYTDNSCTITIYKEWFENTYVYAAHIEFSDYSRLGVVCANGAYNKGYEKTSHAAKRLNAIFAVNADYTTPEMGNDVVRSGVVYNDTLLHAAAVYNAHTGRFTNIDGIGYQKCSDLVANKQITDTLSFFRGMLVSNGQVCNTDNSGRAQRTFIGTNGNAGDIWICVSEGRYNDGVSAGLTKNQCARFMVAKGCTFAIPLDGGGSSTMYFNGKVLNANGANERAVVDFVVFR